MEVTFGMKEKDLFASVRPMTQARLRILARVEDVNRA
jgi:hypothetical protein